MIIEYCPDCGEPYIPMVLHDYCKGKKLEFCSTCVHIALNKLNDEYGSDQINEMQLMDTIKSQVTIQGVVE